MSSRNMETDPNAAVGVSCERPTNISMRERPLPLLRTRSVGQTRELAMVRPVVSCESIHTWARSNVKTTNNSSQMITPNVETVWTLNQRHRNQVMSLRMPCQRNKSFNDAVVPLRPQTNAITTESEGKQELNRRLPPNVIVFINSTVSRQRRRSSSICSQITMDEALYHHDGEEYNEDDDDDHTNASLDIQDVFTECKKFKKSNDDSNKSETSYSSSSYSSSYLSGPTDRLVLQKSKRVPIKTIVRKKSARHIRLHAKLQRRGSTNSAKQRWMQTGKIDGEAMSDNDSQMSDSDYDDYAQDSLGQISRNNIIRRVTNLKVNGDENGNVDIHPVTHNSCGTILEYHHNHHPSMKSNPIAATPSSKSVKIMCGRAA